MGNERVIDWTSETTNDWDQKAKAKFKKLRLFLQRFSQEEIDKMASKMDHKDKTIFYLRVLPICQSGRFRSLQDVARTLGMTRQSAKFREEKLIEMIMSNMFTTQ